MMSDVAKTAPELEKPRAASHPECTLPTIVVVGPGSSMVGGIASVVEQMVSLDFEGRYRVEAFETTFRPDESESVACRLIRHIRHLGKLSKLCRQASPGIVHVHTCSGWSLYRSAADIMTARLAGCATVLHVHGAAFDKFHDEAGPLTRRVISWSLASADMVIALSDGWKEKLSAMAPHARIEVVENSVPQPNDFHRPTHDGPLRLLLLSRMDEWKGVDDLLDAMQLLQASDCRMELVLAGPPGTAGDADTIAEKIRDRRLTGRVRYVGSMLGQLKSELLRWADAYVQPSHHEGLPISLLEALSFGLPIVATRVGAVPEVITHGREGLLVEPRRADLLADSLYELSLCKDVRRAMGAHARNLARSRFSPDRFRDDLVSIYDQVRPGVGRIEQPVRGYTPSWSY